MAHSARFAANAYASVDLATAVATASPHRLTLMLYDAALKNLDLVRSHMEAGRIAEKGEAMSRAMRIVNEGLKATLDLSQGDLAQNLNALYEYISTCLLKANLHNDTVLLTEARSLLAGMRDTWMAIATEVHAPAMVAKARAEFLRSAAAA